MNFFFPNNKYAKKTLHYKYATEILNLGSKKIHYQFLNGTRTDIQFATHTGMKTSTYNFLKTQVASFWALT